MMPMHVHVCMDVERAAEQRVAMWSAQAVQYQPRKQDRTASSHPAIAMWEQYQPFDTLLRVVANDVSTEDQV